MRSVAVPDVTSHAAFMGKLFSSTILAALATFACSVDPAPAELTSEDNGRFVDLAMNQHVYLTLHTVGPGQFGDPVLSSDAVSFEGMTFPITQNPGGPTQTYHFRTHGEGNTLLTIPHDSGRAPFTTTLTCCAQ
jgi:hypothetical protein